MLVCLDSTASGTCRGRGSVTINSAPPSGRFRTSTWPPCCTIIFCTTASPSPVPFALVVKNGRKSFGDTFAGIPPLRRERFRREQPPALRRRSARTLPPHFAPGSATLVSTALRLPQRLRMRLPIESSPEAALLPLLKPPSRPSFAVALSRPEFPAAAHTSRTPSP